MAWLSRGPRIIPAYAGSTVLTKQFDDQGKDHPRVCGEHAMDSTLTIMLAGSSPRMRGAPLSPTPSRRGRRIIPAYAGSTGAGNHTKLKGIRIIPAYAGSTLMIWIVILWSGDHPRVCGEHVGDGLLGVLEPGSSPRMRGAPGP